MCPYSKIFSRRAFPRSPYLKFPQKYVIMFVTKLHFLRLTYERKGGDDKYGLRKAI